MNEVTQHKSVSVKKWYYLSFSIAQSFGHGESSTPEVSLGILKVQNIEQLSVHIVGRHGVNLTRVDRRSIEVDLEVGGTNTAIQ